MSHIRDTVTIITGASEGIGAATARLLAQHGSRVVLASRDENRLAALAEEIAKSGGQASFRVADVTRPRDLEALTAHAMKTYGDIDILVNNAGLMLFSYWRDVVVEDWQRMIATNIGGYLNGIAAVLPHFLSKKSGRILNMSSVSGHSIGPASGVYSATKYFIRAVTESLRAEVGVDSGIQVSMVSPGSISTGWEQKVADPTGRELAQRHAQIAISPERVAEAVVYALDQPTDVTVSDVIIHPTRQAW
ncbi:MAG: SDR family oxidoreductase [Beutenbergiaceae bacterium]